MFRFAIALGTALSLTTFAAQAQDATKGEKVFKKCKSCHQIGEGAKNKVGPVLTGVVGRAAGSFDGYKYGKSMKAAGAAGLVWDEGQLFDYLANPTKFLRAYLDDPKAKAKMTLKLKKEADRSNVIAYLATFGESSAMMNEPSFPDASEPLETASNALCVRNRNSHTHLFAVEADGAERRVKMLQPGETLCTQSNLRNGNGMVSVFENADSVEGCSRLSPLGRTEDMLKYVDFDRCFWGSNT